MNFFWVKDLIIDYRAREWCKLPYPDHPHGCPNYGCKVICPPSAPLIEEFIDINNHIGLVVTGFKLKEHIEKMRLKHPNWTDRQLKCLLYWQPKVNKRLRELAQLYSYAIAGSIYTLCPEAMGVDVIHTARKCGLPIHAHPRDVVFKVALIGYPKRSDKDYG